MAFKNKAVPVEPSTSNPFIVSVEKVRTVSAIENDLTDLALQRLRSVFTSEIQNAVEQYVGQVRHGDLEVGSRLVVDPFARKKALHQKDDPFSKQQFQNRGMGTAVNMVLNAKKHPALWRRVEGEVFNPMLQQLRDVGFRDPVITVKDDPDDLYLVFEVSPPADA
jgi:hypothetical protein